MSKGLEYIKDISYLILENYSDKEPLTEEQKLSKNCFLDYCKCIEKELQRLEAIDNSNPSEALKDLKELHKLAYGNGETSWKIDEIRMSSHIKQVLLKAQEQEEDIIHYKGTIDNLRRDNALLKDIKNEQEKALKIIFEKTVNILLLELAENVDEYNERIIPNGKLTQEEFKLLKRWLEKDE